MMCGALANKSAPLWRLILAGEERSYMQMQREEREGEETGERRETDDRDDDCALFVIFIYYLTSSTLWNLKFKFSIVTN